ncbi:DUF2294 domain-containing protein [Peribacillus kribbensis]|uniref:DUF2294 domain-containing protein n=1 Tax=Peribacillus kribbensis TaxID=356658 RepID=UPI0003FFAC71|nr:Na-translocating system protein MpsC family protein [Peribacillus kribbensis]
MIIRSREKELGSYIGRLLRENFGKGPGSVYATIAKPYITIYIKDFLTPVESRLMNRDQDTYVQKIRDMLMETLIEDIKAYISEHFGLKLKEFYYDWNLSTQSGMFIGIGEENTPNDSDYSYTDQDSVHSVISKVSMEAEKSPEKVSSFLINPRTLLIIRDKILVSIEKELISLNFQETLIVAKRKLEKRLLLKHKPAFENYLKAKIENAFVTWDFELDQSSTIFILKPNNLRQE